MEQEQGTMISIAKKEMHKQTAFKYLGFLDAMRS